MNEPSNTPVRLRKPDWLKQRLPTGPDFEKIKGMIRKDRLHTVCQEAGCPNIWECFSHHTATFLIMGSRCTRNCGFCAVDHGPAGPPDPEEPAKVARMARDMALAYVVVTSVTRDDLPDGGAGLFAATIRALRDEIPGVRVEVLIPDLQGQREAIETVVTAGPDVVNHNLETIPALYPTVRPEADYQRSLALLQTVRDLAPQMMTKSGLMLGVGENREGVRQTLADQLGRDAIARRGLIDLIVIDNQHKGFGIATGHRCQ